MLTRELYTQIEQKYFIKIKFILLALGHVYKSLCVGLCDSFA